MTERVDGIVQTLIDIGARQDRTPGQVAIAWILDHPDITAPILGADLPEHVDEAFRSVEWRLPEQERQALDAVSEVKMPAKWS
jgi:aryl-alcohol dehydrogenase-like predicted oxidoreductase